MHLTPYNYAGNKPITYYDIDGMQSNGEQQSAPGTADKLQPAASTYVDKSQYIKVNNVENEYQFDPQFLGVKVSLFDKTKEFHDWNSQVKSFVKEAINNLDNVQSINSVKIVHVKPVVEDSYKQRDVYMLNKLSVNYSDNSNNQMTYEVNFKVYANSISFSGTSPLDYILIGTSARIFLRQGPTIQGLNNVAKGGKSAFDIAKEGGKHSGFLKNYMGRSADEINKAINTLQTGKRGINTHLDKIANPSKYVPNWNNLRPSHQQSLINGWQKEITNGNEQIQILRSILGN